MLLQYIHRLLWWSWGVFWKLLSSHIAQCSDSTDQALLKLEVQGLLQGVETPAVTELITECMKSVVAGC